METKIKIIQILKDKPLNKQVEGVCEFIDNTFELKQITKQDLIFKYNDTEEKFKELFDYIDQIPINRRTKVVYDMLDVLNDEIEGIKDFCKGNINN